MPSSICEGCGEAEISEANISFFVDKDVGLEEVSATKSELQRSNQPLSSHHELHPTSEQSPTL
jgi:hypothetical protein